MPASTCPCGSNKTFKDCCEPLLSGSLRALTAEQLMRSRFSAYVLHRPEYLYRTWLEKTRPRLQELATSDIEWQRLKVISSHETDTDSQVEFLATGTASGNPVYLHELSHFIKQCEQWLYVDGQQFKPPSKNSQCPCGSGKKFKRCCGQ
jgi:SEC-C motif-containing protein